MSPSRRDLRVWAAGRLARTAGERAGSVREALGHQPEGLRELARERLVADRKDELHDLRLGEVRAELRPVCVGHLAVAAHDAVVNRSAARSRSENAGDVSHVASAASLVSGTPTFTLTA
jgi:hypothetical protein